MYADCCLWCPHAPLPIFGVAGGVECFVGIGAELGFIINYVRLRQEILHGVAVGAPDVRRHGTDSDSLCGVDLLLRFPRLQFLAALRQILVLARVEHVEHGELKHHCLKLFSSIRRRPIDSRCRRLKPRPPDAFVVALRVCHCSRINVANLTHAAQARSYTTMCAITTSPPVKLRPRPRYFLCLLIGVSHARKTRADHPPQARRSPSAATSAAPNGAARPSAPHLVIPLHSKPTSAWSATRSST
jgi:hypothetical protein